MWKILHYLCRSSNHMITVQRRKQRSIFTSLYISVDQLVTSGWPHVQLIGWPADSCHQAHYWPCRMYKSEMGIDPKRTNRTRSLEPSFLKEPNRTRTQCRKAKRTRTEPNLGSHRTQTSNPNRTRTSCLRVGQSSLSDFLADFMVPSTPEVSAEEWGWDGDLSVDAE